MALDITSIPLEDDDATYNKRVHRYVLTQDYILDTYGDNLDVDAGSSDKADVILNEISRQVYRWMYMQVLNNTRPILEYLIAKDTDRREALIQAMGEQYQYARTSGGNLVAHQSGINPETGVSISADSLARMVVSEEVKQTLDSMGMTNRRISYHVTQEEKDTRWTVSNTSGIY